MLALLCFCVATEFSVNKDLYIVLYIVLSGNSLRQTVPRNGDRIVTENSVKSLVYNQFLLGNVTLPRYSTYAVAASWNCITE